MDCVSDSLLRSLTLELSSFLFQRHVVEFIILQWLEKHESKLQIFSETTPELVDHTLLIGNVLPCKTRELLELSVVLVDRHGALLEIAEFLTLKLNNTFRNVVCFEVTAEIIPSDHTTSSGIFVLLEPLSSLIFELKRGKLHKVLRSHIAALEMLADVYEPIICICGLDTVAEGFWLISKELVQ